MTVTEIPKRLVVLLFLQVMGCAYCILAFGAMAKARGIASPEFRLPIDDYIPWIKNCGWLVFLLPCVWFFVHVREWWRNGADFALLRNVVLSGVGAFVVIVVCGLLGTMVAMGAGTIIHAAGEP